MRRRTMFLVSGSLAIRMLRFGSLESEILLFSRSFVAALSGIGLKKNFRDPASRFEWGGIRT